MSATDLIVDGVVLEREIPGLGLVTFEELGPGEWLTKRGEPAKKARRRYQLNGDDLIAVSAITGTLEKPALYQWYERHGIEGTMAGISAGVIDPVWHDGPAAVQIVRSQKLGAEAVRDEAAERGKAIHAVFETLATTGETPSFGDFPFAWRGWLKGAARAWLLMDLEPREAEQIVCNPQHGYAGRPDLIGVGSRKRTLVDYKTGKGRVYEQAHYQTRGYAMALEPSLIEPVEDIIIVGVADDGAVELVRCEASEQDFLDLLNVHLSRKRILAGMAAARRAAKVAHA